MFVALINNLWINLDALYVTHLWLKWFQKILFMRIGSMLKREIRREDKGLQTPILHLGTTHLSKGEIKSNLSVP